MTDKIPKIPEASDPQLLNRSHESAREAWRTFEIMAEFVTATEKLSQVHPAVTIFGSARVKPHHEYYSLTETIARKLSDSGFSVITGGGPGIMEAGNKGAQAGLSPSVGLNIVLPFEQSGNGHQDISCTFQHFFARKAMFVRASCAYVLMPGGFGTLDELTEVLTLIQTKKLNPMPIILVGARFWQGWMEWVHTTLENEGMISKGDHQLMQIEDDPDRIVELIFDHYQRRGFAISAKERETILSNL